MTVDSATLLSLLADRHARDVFVSECKTGPTHGASHLRLDAWAMKRSWANPHTYGYEIKRSRSDFLRDEKWHGYLAYCSHFYLVVPDESVCSKDEVGPGAGLMVASKNGKRLFVRRRAPLRQVSIPEELWRYILMCRAHIGHTENGDRLAYWRQWLAERKEGADLGYRVSSTISVEHREMRRERDAAIKQLEQSREVVDRVERLASDLQISPWISDDELRERMAERAAGIDRELRDALKKAESAIRRALESMATTK